MSGGRFDTVVRVTFGREGGKVDDPEDRGGPTNMGITQATLREAIRRGIVRRDATIDNLTHDEAEKIYFEMFWKESRSPEFPAPLDLCLFDAWVNHSPRAAARLIQTAVGSVPDGIIGDRTVHEAKVVDKVSAVERYSRAREAFMREIVENDRTQAKFLHGWLNRVARIKSVALAEIAA